MTVEMTPQEAELLIAILRGAEDAFAGSNEALSLVLADLRTWRSALLLAYMRERAATSPATSAPVAGL